MGVVPNFSPLFISNPAARLSRDAAGLKYDPSPHVTRSVGALVSKTSVPRLEAVGAAGLRSARCLSVVRTPGPGWVALVSLTGLHRSPSWLFLLLVFAIRNHASCSAPACVQCDLCLNLNSQMPYTVREKLSHRGRARLGRSQAVPSHKSRRSDRRIESTAHGTSGQ